LQVRLKSRRPSEIFPAVFTFVHLPTTALVCDFMLTWDFLLFPLTHTPDFAVFFISTILVLPTVTDPVIICTQISHRWHVQGGHVDEEVQQVVVSFDLLGWIVCFVDGASTTEGESGWEHGGAEHHGRSSCAVMIGLDSEGISAWI
jgi:hypothetical protein